MPGLTDQDFYEAADNGRLPLTAEVVKRYAESWARSPRAELIDRIKSISMLHQESLSLLYLFARRCGGDVIEVGPYIGGSTVAMALGLKDAGGGRLVAIEIGGAYNHPQLPSTDILADLDRNLRAYGVREVVEIVQGWSVRMPTHRKVRRLLGSNRVGLLCIDANGMPGSDLWLYERHLKDDCFMLVDDLVVEGKNVKQLPVAQFIERSTRDGPLEELAVVQWGTWAGRYRRPGLLGRLYYAARDLDGLQPVFGRYRFPRQQIKVALAALRSKRAAP